ncbi:MAG: LysM peptidoglycan-binding domain-containing protein [Verrucomicrobiota bacterium]
MLRGLIKMRVWWALPLAMLLGGCLPSSGPLDEQKDPYFLAGKAHMNSYNFKAAVEAFEKALETNPRSASAHFELGLLYEQKVSEENAPAVAIYHYTRFLDLRPESEHATFIREHIKNCKQELAKPLALTPGSPQTVFHDLEKLKAENLQLRSQMDAWMAYAKSLQTSVPAGSPPPPLVPGSVQPLPPLPVRSNIPALMRPISSTTNVTQATPPATTARKHKVQNGETPAAIAKKYGLSTTKLMEANPGVDAKRLKIGQELSIP